MGLVDTFIAYKFLKIVTTPFEETDAYKLGIIDSKGKILKKRSKLKGSEEKKAYPSVFYTLCWNIKKVLAKVPVLRSKLGSFASALYLLKEECSADISNENLLKCKMLDILEESGITRSEYMNEAFVSLINDDVLPAGTYKHIHDDKIIVVESPLNPIDHFMGYNIFEYNTGDVRIIFTMDDIVEEVVPTNFAGKGTGVAGIGGDEPPGPKKRKRKKENLFRHKIFNLTPEEYDKCRTGKKKYSKWSSLFDEDSESLSAIKSFSYKNPSKPIVVRNSETGDMSLLRRKWSDMRLQHNKRKSI